MKNLLKLIVNAFKAEPAVFIGAVGTLGVGAYQFVTGKIAWPAFEPLVIGFVTRFFVTPANPPTPAP